MIQALHVLLAGLRINAWFDYVRSKANISDAPSREPALYQLQMGLPGGILSDPVDMLLPEGQAWNATAAAWMVAAHEVSLQDPAMVGMVGYL